MRNGDDTKFDKPAGSSRSSWRRAVRHLTGGAVSLLIGMSVCVPRAVSAEAIPSGIWLVSTEVAIQIFDCSGKLCGRVIWLKKPLNLLGLLKRDKLNPDPALRLRHVCGPTIIWNSARDRFQSLGRRLVLQSRRRNNLPDHHAAQIRRPDRSPRLFGASDLRRNQDLCPRSAGHVGGIVLIGRLRRSS